MRIIGGVRIIGGGGWKWFNITMNVTSARNARKPKYIPGKLGKSYTLGRLSNQLHFHPFHLIIFIHKSLSATLEYRINGGVRIIGGGVGNGSI